MSDTTELRTALAGLLSFAAAEEQALLAAAALRPDYDQGSPDRRAAVPLMAHKNKLIGQQAEWISAKRSGQVPAVYGEVDHSSAEVYHGCSAQAQAGQPEQAARTLAEAIEANPDLRANASRDPDLRSLRESGRLEAFR